MKKFQFSLETIMGYRQQVLEGAQQDYAGAQARVLAQEAVVAGLEEEYEDFNQGFCQRKAEGMTMVEAMGSEGCLRALERDIRRETQKLEKLRELAEEKRQVMVQAKQDASTTERLRERKLEDYNKELQKSEEAMIDELVAASWALNRSTP